MGFEVLAGAGCPMLYGVTLKAVRRQECKSARDRVLERLGQTTLPIIYTQKWRFYNDATIDYELSPAGTLPAADSFTKLQLALENTLEKLVDRGHRILIIGDPVQASCSINRPRLLQGPLPHTPEPPCLPVTRESGESFMTLFAKVFSTRTLVQIVVVLTATLVLKALSIHYNFSWATALAAG
jgi:hypothetical protein